MMKGKENRNDEITGAGRGGGGLVGGKGSVFGVGDQIKQREDCWRLWRYLLLGLCMQLSGVVFLFLLPGKMSLEMEESSIMHEGTKIMILIAGYSRYAGRNVQITAFDQSQKPR